MLFIMQMSFIIGILQCSISLNTIPELLEKIYFLNIIFKHITSDECWDTHAYL